MARDFDGANDNIHFGSDASIDGFTVYTMALWAVFDAAGLRGLLNKKTTTFTGFDLYFRGSDRVSLDVNGWSGGNENVDSDLVVDASYNGVRMHLLARYDSGNIANVPDLLMDAVQLVLNVNSFPASGTFTASDGPYNLKMGESAGGAGDIDGRACCVIYHNTKMTDAEANRAMWWGRPFGGLLVYHPFWTDKLTNEGTATADGTATGTTVAAFAVPTVRPGTAMMGMGVGW